MKGRQQLGPNSEELNEFFKHFLCQTAFGQPAPPQQQGTA